MRAFGEPVDGLDVEQFDGGIEIDLPEATLRAYRLSRVRWVRELTDAQEEGESLDFA